MQGAASGTMLERLLSQGTGIKTKLAAGRHTGIGRPQHYRSGVRRPFESPSPPSEGLACRGTAPSSPVEGAVLQARSCSGVRHSYVYPILSQWNTAVGGSHPPTAKFCEQLWDFAPRVPPVRMPRSCRAFSWCHGACVITVSQQGWRTGSSKPPNHQQERSLRRRWHETTGALLSRTCSR